MDWDRPGRRWNVRYRRLVCQLPPPFLEANLCRIQTSQGDDPHVCQEVVSVMVTPDKTKWLKRLRQLERIETDLRVMQPLQRLSVNYRLSR